MSQTRALQKQWQEIVTRLERLSRRERIQMVLLLLIVVGAVWSQLIMDPFTKERVNLDKQRVSVEKGIREMAALESEVLARKDKHPDQQAKERIERLQGEVDSLDKKMAAGLRGLIAPGDMPKLLGEMLAAESGLTLISIDIEPPQNLLEGEKGDRSLFQHALMLRFSGDYLNVLRYLHELEKKPWKIFWDAVEFVVADYPVSYVTLRIHTLSFSPAILGKGE
ncbi:MAG: hypothetical protein H7834_09680 [Magnetococcus sp. YQC-9]